MASYHATRAGEVLAALGVDPRQGLSAEEVDKRAKEFGPNEIRERPGKNPLVIFLGEFKNFLVLILLGAAVVSAFVGEWLDAAAIFAIVILNAVIGFVQEYRAERSLAALKKLLAPLAKVVRGGREQRVPARDLVPGDLLILEAGDRVPADCRLIETALFRVDESPLTGESTPVEKDAAGLAAEDAPVADRHNLAFMGTTAVHGRARAAVVGTGMRTEFGRIAQLVEEAKAEETPLQRRLDVLAKQLGGVFLAVSALVFVAGYLRGVPALEMFLTAVSLAVAAIPEGLPAIVTITLAIGVQRMARRNSIIRHLPAAETLGSATVICSDKTGTMTKNEMTVRRVWAGGQTYEVTGTGYGPEGQILLDTRTVRSGQDPALDWLLRAAALCNNASLERTPEGRWLVLGDPTEGCLLAVAAKGGLDRARLEPEWPRIAELPFESERKRMSTLHVNGGETYVLVKGAPELLLERCEFTVEEGQVVALTPERRQVILGENRRMASEALRVLGFAYRGLRGGREPHAPEGHLTEELVERDLVFTGLAGMIDPPRPEVAEAIHACRQAGIRVCMITGDHEGTAVAIARELGLLPAGQEGVVMTGAQLEKASDAELAARAQAVHVFARVSPEHKVRIVNALKASGADVVAMTGDGVNDAPALKRSDIGVAMGLTGTDVAKEASAMVITDDNFASIVAAVEEGRVVFDNIKKSVRYLLSCNIGEVVTVFVATMAGFPLILLPLQILWMNLVTDSLPAIALGVDPREPDVMQRKPRNPRAAIIDRMGVTRMASLGVLMAASVFAAFAYVLFSGVSNGGDLLDRSRTAAFTTIVGFQLFFALSARSERHSLSHLGFGSNRWLWAAFGTGLLLQLAVVYWGPAQALFETAPLLPDELAVALGLAFGGFAAPELAKWLRHGRVETTA
jgi:Ca2+-transporting ATPase